MHLKVLGEIDPTNCIGNHPQGPRSYHHRHNRKPVQPICQVDRIGRANDDDHGKGHKQHTKVQKRVFEHRQRQLILQRIWMIGPPPKTQQYPL